MSDASPAPGLTLDAFLGGRLQIAQPASGYRAGLDAMLLAAAVPAGARLLEAGCGVGAALLAVALRRPKAHLIGVEREVAIGDLAAANVVRNGLGDRVRIEIGDVLADTGGGFDGVFCNPPYFEAGRGQAPADSKRHAYVADQPLDRWVARLADRLIGGGTLTLIHRADSLADLLAALRGRLGGVKVLALHPRAGVSATRVIVWATKGSRAAPSIAPGLVIHAQGGGFTPLIDACLKGEAELPKPV